MTRRLPQNVKWAFLLLILLYTLPVNAQKLVQRLVLIGDAGLLKKGKHSVVEAALSSSLINAQTSIIFLGDNVYPHGLPALGARNYEWYTKVLDAQLQIASQSPAQVFFIPGNHDWANGRSDGLEMLNNQQRYIDSAHLPNAHFFPGNGCPGPEEIILTPGVVLLIVDSQWWLQEGEKPGISSDCDCKTGDEVSARLNDIAYRHRNDIIILASHHAFHTYGPHGGYFTIKQHLFPLTDINKKLWVPLPLIGSVYPISRKVFGNVEDTRHPLYRKMTSHITLPFENHPSTVFVHGHDHNLQHILYNNKNYIVSGSGAKTSRVHKGKYSKFAAAVNGYAVMDVMDNRSITISYYSSTNKQLYTYTDTLTKLTATGTIAVTPPPAVDTVTVVAGKEYNVASGLKRWLFGQSYREVWAEPVRVRVFHVTKEKGGLKILQRGGGKQTRSLRLEDKTGKQWVVRSINKNPVSALPPALQETFAVDIVQDQISAAHPYAPLVIPILAEAVGVPHANPEFVWIPADTALGGYEADFANTLCLFEEREPGITGRSYSTAKVLENLEEDNDDHINQQAVLKARLFDMFIGDWDRHEDQWRWGAVKNDRGKTYYPVPRDRDQAFFINNGWVTWLAAQPHLVPSVQGFRKKFRNINTFNFSSRYFDRNFLNALDEKTWREAAEAMTKALTDSVIDRAINCLPDNILAISGEALRNILKGKRNYFVKDIMTYYRSLAHTIEITGSDKRERFTLTPLPNKRILLQVHKITKNDTDTVLLYRREIDPRETKELRLYGMGGADQFITDSLITTKLNLRIIGGKGKDKYHTASSLRTFIYERTGEENDLSETGSASIRTSRDASINTYNRTSFKYDQNIPQFTIGFNPDDGLSLGAGVKMIRNGFRQSPKAVYHFMASHSLSTRAFRFKAGATFNQLLGKTGLSLYADIKSPNNTTNFFGYGNSSVYTNIGKGQFRFYRARYNLIKTGANLLSNIGRHIRVQYGVGYQFYSMDDDDNQNRYILQTGINGLVNDQVLQRKHYLTSDLGVQIDSRNNKSNPNRGIYWNTEAEAAGGLNRFSKNTLTLQTDLRFYAALNDPAKLVLAARIGAGHIWGNFNFFQAMQLGNHDNLRGYRNHRFAGRSMVYSNTELRIKLFDFAGYLFPGTIGLIGFNDIGRVWYKGNESATWHNTPGAGLYVSPAGLVVISATVGFSKEETLPFVSVGFRF